MAAMPTDSILTIILGWALKGQKAKLMDYKQPSCRQASTRPGTRAGPRKA